ncbi:hypothetical protein [Paraburkholderia solisilvae]|uniref:Uncharacterized protein n=1 Tax=Paraburkholderia solisilvae TaxID=624376 RepID=A0A6J5EV76_9BURK|nr:hypothetical protein [Paraburkholderia solisilvae]CAB3770459.1 hypothetical protein LMG29739_05788 [Paraburkholderia solisilvae]
MLEGQPTRLDLVLWDAAGYIYGWFLDRSGRPELRAGSCPEIVAGLAGALQTLASYDQSWQAALERRATSLMSIVRLSKEKAVLQARAKMESRGFLKKFVSRTSLERELMSLGFR